jgi:N,N'-diacetylbacillosaminyl-diphospho-undecaprenol alpha-1,3-N-acetylgalactosaminyltransferase
LAAILSTARVFVLPSLKEGLPLSLIEAMSCGKAVAASDIESVRQLISNQESGLLFETGSACRLADALAELLRDENLRKSLGRNARDEVLRKYSFECVLPKLAELYAEAVDMSGHPTPT